MLDIYARSFLEATRSSDNGQQDPRTRRRLAQEAARQEQAARIWWRRPYWV